MDTRNAQPAYQPEPTPFNLGDLPGLRFAGIPAGIKKSGKPDIGLLVADRAVPAAAIFTQNKLASPAVVVSREHLARSHGLVRAVVVNSGNANACTGEQGLSNARSMAAAVARLAECPDEQVLVCSTGVIGHPLPMEAVLGGIQTAWAALSSGAKAANAFSRAIQTTDAFDKQAAGEFRGVRAAGVCKGAGMIAPNMATMLAFVAIDANIPQQQLSHDVMAIADRSFNAVHVDSHPSTNDSFILLATGQSPPPADPLPLLERVCHRLAWLIARDGEGASKVTTIHVAGAAHPDAARSVARAVASSALVRTALFGNDPNWGRFVSQVANCGEVSNAMGIACRVGQTPVFARGEPMPFKKADLSREMSATDDLHLHIDLADGEASAMLMTADLGYRYIEINAEYTT